MMLNYLKQEANKTVTENGAVTYRSTGSACLDMFASIGALRNAENRRVEGIFWNAWAEDRDTAIKILFYARDIRGGLGERKVFRTMFQDLAQYEPESAAKNLGYIAEYGRFDDLLILFDTPCEKAAVNLIAAQLREDIKTVQAGGSAVSLLAKWLPSVNASSPETVRTAKRLAKALNMKEADYRHILSVLRQKIAILENNLREKKYTFDYEKQPSRAMYRYRKAFIRNDGDRYRDYVGRVSRGEAKMNAAALYPYDIVAPLTGNNYRTITKDEKAAMDAAWKSLPDYAPDSNGLVVIDGSGSMYVNVHPSPASVALSLGIYFAERNQGLFHNHFITFSESPRLVEIKGKDIAEKVRYCESFNEVANTNIQAVFELILKTAVNNRLEQKEMPDCIYIVSDMEFDSCVRDRSATNFEYAKKQFGMHGYRLPDVVFWNVASRHNQNPVRMNEQGVALVSGCTPSLFEMAAGGKLSPYEQMMEIIGSARYQKIMA